MRAIQTPLAAAVVLAALLLATPLAQAQIKAAVGGHQADDEELKNGNLVTVTLKDGKKLVGTYVRSEAGKLYVRTEPRTLPVAVPEADVTKVQRSMIIPAGGRTGIANQPEIHRVTIYNGPEMTVRYVAPNLSPSELSRLNELEAAENEYGRVNSLAALSQEYVRDEQRLEKWRFQAERNYYRFSSLAAMGFYPGTALTAFPNYGYVNFGGSPYFAMQSLYSGSGYVSGQFVPGGFGAVPIAPGYYNGSSYPPPPNLAMGNEGVIKSTLGAALVKMASPEAVAQAKHSVDVARSHMVFEGDRVVAVKTSEGDYKRGDRVIVTPKEGHKITGTIVSSTDDRLLLRTQPNAAPMMLRWSNIEAVEPQAIKGAGNQ